MHPWRARLHRWFAPVARRSPLSPNAISLIALLLNAGAATLLYYGARKPILFLVAIVVITIAGLADAFDGIVAREQQKETRYGDFLDHFADRVSDLLLLGGWLIGNSVRIELTTIAMIAVMLNGYIGTQIEASWHERSYESVGRGEFVLALVVYPIVSYILASNGWRDIRYAHFTAAEGMTFALLAFALLGIVQRLKMASRLGKS